MAKATTAYPYLRYSSTRQGQGDSERRQSTWHEDVAKREGWELDYSFRLEDKGKSAFKGDHLKADLGRFLNAINTGHVKPGSVLMFEEMDRLSRQDLGKSFPLLLGILTSGVHVRTGDKHYTEESVNDLGMMVGALCDLHSAHVEVKRKAGRIAANWANWRKQITDGKKVPPPGRPPFWVRWNGEAFELVLEVAGTVRLIFKWAAEGLGISLILKRLNEQNLTRPGKPWRFSAVGEMLRTRLVLGDLTTKDGMTHRGFYPRPSPRRIGCGPAPRWLRARSGGRAWGAPGRTLATC
jgi:DNA invertase Pin-like site-specific DNA recombinase